jgi:hypothetical protein
VLAAERLDRAPGALGGLAPRAALERDHQRRPDQRQRALAGDREQPPVEQVARHRPQRAQVQPGAHGRVQRREAEQRQARPAGQRDGAQRGLCDHGQRALRADQELRQIDAGGCEYAVELVAAAVERRPRPRDRDALRVGPQQLDHFFNDRACST